MNQKRNEFSKNSLNSQRTKLRLGLLFFSGMFLFVMALPLRGVAARLDVSGSGSYSKQNYGANEGFSTSRRWSGGVAYRLSGDSSIEFSYAQISTDTQITGIRNIRLRDQVFGLTWIQAFLPDSWPIQPYVKGGVGRMIRKAQENDFYYGETTVAYQTLNGILGIGGRIKLTERVVFRIEATRYLTNARIKNWKDNYGVTFGFSLFL